MKYTIINGMIIRQFMEIFMKKNINEENTYVYVDYENNTLQNLFILGYTFGYNFL